MGCERWQSPTRGENRFRKESWDGEVALADNPVACSVHSRAAHCVVDPGSSFLSVAADRVLSIPRLPALCVDPCPLAHDRGQPILGQDQQSATDGTARPSRTPCLGGIAEAARLVTAEPGTSHSPLAGTTTCLRTRQSSLQQSPVADSPQAATSISPPESPAEPQTCSPT